MFASGYETKPALSVPILIVDDAAVPTELKGGDAPPPTALAGKEEEEEEGKEEELRKSRAESRRRKKDVESKRIKDARDYKLYFFDPLFMNSFMELQ